MVAYLSRLMPAPGLSLKTWLQVSRTWYSARPTDVLRPPFEGRHHGAMASSSARVLSMKC